MEAGHILVVEDHEDSREMLADLLQSHGYRVETAANGQLALEKMRAGSRPALILLDLTMPVMDGWQLSEELRRDVQLSAVPVVVVSAVLHPELPPGCREHLEKPVDIQRLLQVVSRLVAKDPG